MSAIQESKHRWRYKMSLSFIVAERESRAEEEIPLLTTSIKADVDVKMGIVSDVKQELRKAQAYKINYSTRKEQK